MMITQRNPFLFAPVINTVQISVIDNQGSTSSVSYNGFNYIRYISSDFHYEYRIEGSGLNGIAVSHSTHAVNLSEENNVLSRGAGVNSIVSVRFNNNRGSSELLRFNFTNSNSQTTYSDLQSVASGTYAEYSWNRVSEIFSALDNGTPDNHKVFDIETGIRRQTSIIPHLSLTCQSNGSILPGGQKRFTAITKRHVIGCGHYGLHPEGRVCYFRDVNNNLITRYAVRAYNTRTGPYALTDPSFDLFGDIEIWLLDSDLPNEISPAPILGDWFYNYSGNQTEYNVSGNSFGFWSWNQDTHICPIQVGGPIAAPRVVNAAVTLAGVSLSGRDFDYFATNGGAISLDGYSDWNFYNVTSKFYHDVRPGDSGSPKFFPVDGGWALGGISGHLWRPIGLNALIKAVDALHGINTGYTVTVAPQPTL